MSSLLSSESESNIITSGKELHFSHSMSLFNYISQQKSLLNEYDYNKNFQLNNQGCKCLLCQKLIINQNLKIIKSQINDPQSEEYQTVQQQQFYVKLVQQISYLWKFKRNIRFSLPEICFFEQMNPAGLIEKKKQIQNISIIKHKAHMHVFDIQNFFLNGYISHNPQKKTKKSKNQAVHTPYLNECIIFAKYKSNIYRMLTYNQIQNFFRSKNKRMKQGLLYLQTIVGGQFFKTVTMRINLDQITDSQITYNLWQKAKKQVQIIVNEIKPTDFGQYYDEKQQIKFQISLKELDFTHYLVYLSYKILLLNSKINNKIMKKSIFKYSILDNKVYLFDLRVSQFGQSFGYWSSNQVKALQIKIKKRMNMMEIDNPEHQKKYDLSQKNLSSKAMELSNWLASSTKDQFNQMKIIRKRLEKLQQEKLSLQKSQQQQAMKKNFKVRNLRRREKLQNPQFSLLL